MVSSLTGLIKDMYGLGLRRDDLVRDVYGLGLRRDVLDSKNKQQVGWKGLRVVEAKVLDA